VSRPGIRICTFSALYATALYATAFYAVAFYATAFYAKAVTCIIPQKPPAEGLPKSATPRVFA